MRRAGVCGLLDAARQHNAARRWQRSAAADEVLAVSPLQLSLMLVGIFEVAIRPSAIDGELGGALESLLTRIDAGPGLTAAQGEHGAVDRQFRCIKSNGMRVHAHRHAPSRFVARKMDDAR